MHPATAATLRRMRVLLPFGVAAGLLLGPADALVILSPGLAAIALAWRAARTSHERPTRAEIALLPISFEAMLTAVVALCGAALSAVPAVVAQVVPEGPVGVPAGVALAWVLVLRGGLLVLREWRVAA